ncbi:MAG: head maturation protease, ClpP-related [Janthinobacterium lividum]
MRRNRIQQLLHDNRGAPRTFQVVASDDTEATVYLYDYVVADEWDGGVCAQHFVRALADITAPVIHLRINSPGGDVFAARAMEVALRGHPAKVVAHIDGLAASAASFLAMAADEIEIAEGGFFMIHQAWTAIWGNATELREEAALLDKIDQTLVATYAQRSGQAETDIAAWMAAETWFGADEAIAVGFADRKMVFQEASGASDSASASALAAARLPGWNLSAFHNVPSSLDTAVTGARTALPDISGAAGRSVRPAAGDAGAVDFAAMRRRVALHLRL